MSASVTIGAGAGGSFISSKSNISSDYASVVERSGLKAGDGGFQVNVAGNTTLIGGAITSNQSAVENNLNRFSTCNFEKPSREHSEESLFFLSTVALSPLV